MHRIAVLINTKDRPTELGLLLQSLRTQTIKDFDIFILDDLGGTPVNTYYFINMLIVRMKLEGNEVNIDRTEFPYGVSRARQKIVDMAKGYELMLRVDDDCILESDYIERLLKVLDQGYDMATGVTIPFQSTFKREPKYLRGVINRIVLDNEGNFLFNGDDCGMPYTESVILPAHHFRSCALYKSKIHEKVNYYPTKLSMNGYREEEIFSLKMLIEGFTIGCDTGAVNYHLMTPSGGERNTMNMAPFNQSILLEFVKENQEAIRKVTSKYEDLEPNEYKKESNLLR